MAEEVRGAAAGRGVTAITLVTLVFFVGCSRPIPVPNLGGLYDRTAQYHGLDRNPVIVLPGILGSRLKDGQGRTVWGAFSGDYVAPRGEGARTIAIPMVKGANLAELRDDVVSVGALDRIQLNLLGIPIMVRAYAQVLGVLGVGGYRDEELGLAGSVDYGDEHFTCFQFHYDWRRDNAENAALLYDFIREKREYVRQKLIQRYGSAPEDLRFDIVAHSMGGLVTRYMLRYGDEPLPAEGPVPPVTWKGAEFVDRVILVGTPNAGSLHAVLQLVGGYRPGPFLPRYGTAILGSFPSIYQLLPRSRHQPLVTAGPSPKPVADLLDPGLWKRNGWGLASPEADDMLQTLLPETPDPAARREIAQDHLEKCLRQARRLFEALDSPAQPPESVELYLFVGDATDTPAVAAVSEAGAVNVITEGPGDGTVLRTSVLLDERRADQWSPFIQSPLKWEQVFFLFTNHLDLTRDPAFADNLLFLLLESRKD